MRVAPEGSMRKEQEVVRDQPRSEPAPLRSTCVRGGSSRATPIQSRTNVFWASRLYLHGFKLLMIFTGIQLFSQERMAA